MDIVFLAAGMGQRISKKKLKHKSLMKVIKKSLITRLIQNAISSKIKNLNIVIGHNGKYIKKHLKKYKINFIENYYFKKKNIAYSIYLALANTPIKNDLLISYSDIFYKKDLLELILKKKGENLLIPVLKNWKRVWNYRKENIFRDAENLITYDNKIISIGKKISNPSKIEFQYMGLIFIPKNLKKTLIKTFHKYNLDSFDGTKLLNKLIKEKFSLNYIKYNGIWYEFDKPKDEKNFPRYLKNFKF